MTGEAGAPVLAAMTLPPDAATATYHDGNGGYFVEEYDPVYVVASAFHSRLCNEGTGRYTTENMNERGCLCLCAWT
jgi:hypothetical protein